MPPSLTRRASGKGPAIQSAGPRDLALALSAGSENAPDHVRAAVGLLIEHGYWLNRADFAAVCIRQSGRLAGISWGAARKFAAGELSAPPACRVILDLAVLIGGNEMNAQCLGPASREMMARAFSRAMQAGQ